MNHTKPACGHSVLRPDCRDCKQLLNKWYKKLSAADPDWLDIEYGQENPEFLGGPFRSGDQVDPSATAYYDKVWSVYHDWVKAGRSRRDCTVAELLAKQERDTGTVRGITAYLKSKRLRPYSKSMVHKTIKEIDCLVFQIGQRRPSVEQAPKALHPTDSKPLREEANGKADKESDLDWRVHAA